MKNPSSHRRNSILTLPLSLLFLSSNIMPPRTITSFAFTHLPTIRHRLHPFGYSQHQRSSSLSSLLTTTHRHQTSSSSSSSLSATPPQWSTDDVRTTFINYFTTQKSHTPYPSSPCIPPPSDTTLLFTNAGMNQFKPIFLNQIPPNTPLENLKRAVNSQKCIRAGGKHNDLEDVGKDTYHHTFFEMLGSWSFGDYFKKEAIDMAWELLVGEYGLDKDRLYATYYEGDDTIPPDTDARDYWSQYLPPDRILPCPAKDNFWEMGDTGPCGPCTEIHYDRIGGRDAAALVNADDPDVIEIWNLVFIQFNRDEAGGELRSLPQQHVDTGMGLERLVSILQNVRSNYDIDSFRYIIDGIENVANVRKYEGKVGPDDAPELIDTAYRAVADHIRTLCFAIADGAVPSNEGRGYVLRRVLRRAERYGLQILKAESGFMAELVPVVIDTYATTYPELLTSRDTITQIITEEESSFSSMLERGIKRFTSLQADIAEKDDGKALISGAEAFYLYDTLGFPLDLTELMALESGLSVDVEGFQEAMAEQKERSREAQKAARRVRDGVGVTLELGTDDTARLEKGGCKVTDDDFKYKEEDVEAVVVAVYEADEEDEDDAETMTVGVVLDKTSFYAEAGGQEADRGTITLGDTTITITDVQVYAGYVLHVGTIPKAAQKPTVDDTVTCRVDYDRRKKITPNHTMTHVLNAALRKVLGDDVNQKGSLNNDEKLRFDFSHNKALSVKELTAVEDYVNAVIKEERDVTDNVMPLDEAKKIPGVAAVFGEVYPDPVRVVAVDNDVSVEFCGGTHIKNTREAEAFVILEETAVAKGIRRITAVTRDVAKGAMAEGTAFESDLVTIETETADLKPGDLVTLDKTAGSLRKSLDELSLSAPLKTALRARIETLQKKGMAAKKAVLAQRVDVTLNAIEKELDALSSSTRTLVMTLDIGTDSKASQKVMKLCQKRNIAFLGISSENDDDGKAMVFACVPDDMTDMIKANEWVKASLDSVGGRGGGKAGSAQGQVKGCEDVNVIEEAARRYLEETSAVEAM